MYLQFFVHIHWQRTCLPTASHMLSRKSTPMQMNITRADWWLVGETFREFSLFVIEPSHGESNGSCAWLDACLSTRRAWATPCSDIAMVVEFTSNFRCLRVLASATRTVSVQAALDRVFSAHREVEGGLPCSMGMQRHVC